MKYKTYITAIIIGEIILSVQGLAFDDGEPEKKNRHGVVGTLESTYMETAYHRVGELAKEGNLPVKTNIRLRDNFNRLRDQVSGLVSVRTQQNRSTEKQEEAQQSVRSFLKCLNFDGLLKTPALLVKGDFVKCKGDLDLFTLTKPKQTAQKIFPTSTAPSATSYTEGIGTLEWSYMRATVTRIGELHNEGVLDVDPQYRIRDNFNRANRQVLQLKKGINAQDEILQTRFTAFDDFKKCANGLAAAKAFDPNIDSVKRCKNAFDVMWGAKS